jgi:hypothetical protein
MIGGARGTPRPPACRSRRTVSGSTRCRLRAALRDEVDVANGLRAGGKRVAEERLRAEMDGDFDRRLAGAGDGAPNAQVEEFVRLEDAGVGDGAGAAGQVAELDVAAAVDEFRAVTVDPEGGAGRGRVGVAVDEDVGGRLTGRAEAVRKRAVRAARAATRDQRGGRADDMAGGPPPTSRIGTAPGNGLPGVRSL